jgi:spore maturation protein CgeB
MNKDTYTRRNFEIPAIGTAVLSQYSDDLASLFRENEEIAFFSDTATLIKRAQELLHDVPLRKRIADGGSARVRTDGHDVDARMRGLAQAFESAGR